MISPFELFSVGIGPSSSHTMGPMRAARTFAATLRSAGVLADVAGVSVELFGSLALTGRGHGTDTAVTLGLCGHRPESVDPDGIPGILDTVERTRTLPLLGMRDIPFSPADDIVLRRRERLPGHHNALRLDARDAGGASVLEQTWYSIGGGSIVLEGGRRAAAADAVPMPYPFASGRELLRHTEAHGLSIAELVVANEASRRGSDEIEHGLLEIWQAMKACVARGLRREGTLPGGLEVPRRAPALHRRLRDRDDGHDLTTLDWLNLWALAVNEENAAGGRVVTAPTNGAAGVVPAVLHYYDACVPGASDDGVVEFLLTATAVGSLIKSNASISGAEVGCQGEIGSACAMAAAGLAAVWGGTPAQVENAAEIGLEHNLGLTCDPVGGLVQIPCIERNAVAAVAAVNAARLALHGDGRHHISLDQAIHTLRETGADMHDKYKETAQGGLAVAVAQC